MTTAKFHSLEPRRCEDIKGTDCGTRNRPEKFRDFRETGPSSQLPVGLNAQQVEHCTGIAEVMIQIPLRPENFRSSGLPIA